MRIAILGAGAIGSMLGMYLQEGGADLCLVDPYKAHMEKIATEGLKLTSTAGENKLVKMKTYTSPDDVGVVDLIIVLVKGLFTRQALENARAMIGEKTCVLTCQNGLGQEEALHEFFQKEKIMMGCLGFSSALQAPGEIYGTINRNPDKVHLYVGCLDHVNGPKDMARQIAEYAVQGSLNAHYAENVLIPIWEKAASNCSCNAMCGIARLTLGQMYGTAAGKTIHNSVMRELCTVANAMGIPLDADKLITYFEDVTFAGVCKHYPSTAQDMFNKKQTEIEFLNGAVVRYGQKLGIPTPYNEMIANFVRAIEANYDNLREI